MRPLFKRLASAAILSSISTLFISETIAKPQNARSRIYNEFHTDLFAKEPPLRSECPSWNDVVKGDTFDNEAFSAISKNGRPCFVNRSKYTYDIRFSSGNILFGQNFSVYRTERLNHYEIDIPVKFHTGRIGGIKSKDYTIFKNRFQGCIKNNTIPLTDGERTLRINVPIIIEDSASHKRFSYTSFYTNPEININKSLGLTGINNIFSIVLYNKLERNFTQKYSILIPCATIIHELLHIPGLLDLYENINRITGKRKTYNGFIPRGTKKEILNFKKKRCGHISEGNCKDLIQRYGLSYGLTRKKKFPLYDCRNPKDYKYQTPNIMNNHGFFDIVNFPSDRPIILKVCKTEKPTEDKYTNREQNQCDQQDKQLLSAVVSTVEKLKNVHRHADNTLKLKKSEYYIAYYDRRDTNQLPPSLTREQLSFILHTNNLNHPEVREFARVAKNTVRNKYDYGPLGGCRR